jgi:hypothetical protein
MICRDSNLFSFFQIKVNFGKTQYFKCSPVRLLICNLCHILGRGQMVSRTVPFQ